MRTCLFGGTFDPVHSGHLGIAQAVRRELAPMRVVFLPAAQSPFKVGERHLFSSEQRLALLRTAVQGEEAEVSELDLRLPPPSRSWRVVQLWLSSHSEEELFWLLGTDEWAELHRWSRPDFLARHLTFVVYHRGAQPMPRPGFRSIFLHGEEFPASASEIRRRLCNNLPLPPDWLPPPVESLARRFLDTIDTCASLS